MWWPVPILERSGSPPRVASSEWKMFLSGNSKGFRNCILGVCVHLGHRQLCSIWMGAHRGSIGAGSDKSLSECPGALVSMCRGMLTASYQAEASGLQGIVSPLSDWDSTLLELLTHISKAPYQVPTINWWRTSFYFSVPWVPSTEKKFSIVLMSKEFCCLSQNIYWKSPSELGASAYMSITDTYG